MNEYELLQEMNMHINNIIDSDVDEKLELIKIIVEKYNQLLFNLRNGVK